MKNRCLAYLSILTVAYAHPEPDHEPTHRTLPSETIAHATLSPYYMMGAMFVMCAGTLLYKRDGSNATEKIATDIVTAASNAARKAVNTNSVALNAVALEELADLKERLQALEARIAARRMSCPGWIEA